MKRVTFNDYLRQSYTPDEIEDMREKARIECEYLRALQENISSAIAEYMSDEQIGFNELQRRLGISASQLARLQKGEANITLATLAHFAALKGKKPVIKFSESKK